MVDEIVERLPGPARGVTGQSKCVQAARMVAEPLVDQTRARPASPRRARNDRGGGKLAGPCLAEGLAVLGVVVPLPARRLAVVHQARRSCAASRGRNTPAGAACGPRRARRTRRASRRSGDRGGSPAAPAARPPPARTARLTRHSPGSTSTILFGPPAWQRSHGISAAKLPAIARVVQLRGTATVHPRLRSVSRKCRIAARNTAILALCVQTWVASSATSAIQTASESRRSRRTRRSRGPAGHRARRQAGRLARWRILTSSGFPTENCLHRRRRCRPGNMGGVSFDARSAS